MNKTLLLIICDFLLLNLIHFTAWDKLDEDSSKAPATGGPVAPGTGMGDPSQDLEFVTLKYKNIKADRENEKIKNAALQAEMNANQQQSAENLSAAIKNANAWKNVFDEAAKANEVLEAATRELDRTKTIALAERDKERILKETLTQERIKLQANNRDLNATVKTLNLKIGDLTGLVNTAEGNAKAEREKAEKAAAKAQAALIAKTKAEGERDKAVTIAATAKSSADKMVADAKLTADNQIKTIRTFAAQQLTAANTRVVNAEKEVKVAVAETQAVKAQAAETTRKLVVADAKTEELSKDVVQEKTEKLKAQKYLGVAQKAVEDLTEKIAKRIPDQPINANTMATLYFQNRLELQLQAFRSLSRKKMTSPTVLIEITESGKPYVYAITHTKDTPYRLSRNVLAFRESYGALAAAAGGSKPQALHHVRFLKADPRLIIIPLGPANSKQVKALGVKPYKLAAKPYKFPKAFIMSKNGSKYGTVEFKIDPKHRGYVKVDRIFFNFAGKFNPAKGDLVFSQTNELLGIMANNKYCLVLQSAAPANAIMFGKNDSSKVAQVLGNMQKLIAAKPFALQ